MARPPRYIPEPKLLCRANWLTVKPDLYTVIMCPLRMGMGSTILPVADNFSRDEAKDMVDDLNKIFYDFQHAEEEEEE